MIRIPRDLSELLFMPEFALPLSFVNSNLFIPPVWKDKTNSVVQGRIKRADLLHDKKAKSNPAQGKVASEFIVILANEITTFEEEHSNSLVATEYMDWMKKIMKRANSIGAEKQVLELISSLEQKTIAYRLFSDYKQRADFVPFVLYYHLITKILLEEKDYEKAFDFISLADFSYSLLDDDEVKFNRENVDDEQKKIIVEKLRKRQAKNTLAYSYILRSIPSTPRQRIDGAFCIRTPMSSIKNSSIVNSQNSTGEIASDDLVYTIEYPNDGCSVEEVKYAPYDASILKYIDDKDLLDYRFLYQNADYVKLLEDGRIHVSDIIRLNKIGIIRDNNLKKDLKKFIRKNKSWNDNEEKATEFALIGIYLAKEKDVSYNKQFNVNYIEYKEMFDNGKIKVEDFLSAIEKGWIDVNSIIRLVHDGYLPRKSVDEVLEKSNKNVFKGSQNYNKYEELFQKGEIDVNSFIAAIRYGWIDKYSVIHLMANNRIPHNDAIEALEHSPRRNYNELHNCDIETQLLAWCATYKSSLGWISVGDLEKRIRELKKDDDNSKVYTFDDTLVEKVVNLIHGDYNQLSALLTSTAFDYNSMDEVIEKSNEKGYLSDDGLSSLRRVVRRFRIDQLKNHPNAVEYNEDDYIDIEEDTTIDGEDTPVDPPEQQSIRLIYDPVKRLKFFAANNNPNNPSIGDLKRIIIDGTYVDENGNERQSSLHGYELIVLPEIGCTVLEKLYESERIEKIDSDGNKYYKMQYKRNKEGHLIPVKGNNKTFFPETDDALGLAQRSSKRELKDNNCLRCIHTMTWGQLVSNAFIKILDRNLEKDRGTVPAENIESARTKVDLAIEKYVGILENNYLALLESQRNGR